MATVSARTEVFNDVIGRLRNVLDASGWLEEGTTSANTLQTWNRLEAHYRTVLSESVGNGQRAGTLQESVNTMRTQLETVQREQ